MLKALSDDPVPTAGPSREQVECGLEGSWDRLGRTGDLALTTMPPGPGREAQAVGKKEPFYKLWTVYSC